MTAKEIKGGHETTGVNLIKNSLGFESLLEEWNVYARSVPLLGAVLSGLELPC